MRILLSLFVIALAACAVLPRNDEHGVADTRLRDTMRRLDTLTRDRLPKALDLEREHARRAAAVRETADAVAASAAELRRLNAFAQAAPAERQQFIRYAEALGRSARALSQRAQQRDLEAMRAAAADIEVACSGCHRRFGGPD